MYGSPPMRFIYSFLATAASLWVAVWLIDGLQFDGEWYQFVLVAAILGLANAIVKPILKLFSLPLILLTLGLFLVVVNALVLSLVIWLSGVFELGLTSDGFFWSTFWAAVVISLVGWLLDFVIPDSD